MTATLANGYLSESTQRELSNEYQLERALFGFQKYLHTCSLDLSSLSIGRVQLDCMLVTDYFNLQKYKMGCFRFSSLRMKMAGCENI